MLCIAVKGYKEVVVGRYRIIGYVVALALAVVRLWGD